MVAGDYQQGVVPIEPVTGKVDISDGGFDGSVQIAHGSQHPSIIVGMVGPIDVPLFDQEKEAVFIFGEALQGSSGSLGQGRIFDTGGHKGRRSRLVQRSRGIEVASGAAKQAEQLLLPNNGPLGAGH